MKPASKSLRALSISIAGACSLTGIADLAYAATSYLGDPVNYSFGIVQVQITVDDAGKITKIDTPQSSTSGSNASYTHYAVPILVTEALKVQSANIQGVSGASYLSRGWITSLASAIAQISHGSVATPTATPTRTVAPAPAPTLIFGGDDQGGGENGERSESGEGPNRKPRTPIAPSPVIKTPTPTPTPTPTLSQPPLVLKPGAGVIQKSITCVKGSAKKVVKGVQPKCPTGYTLKKP